MALGAKIRALCGPYEPLVSNAWRALFVDLDQWTRTIAEWAGQNDRPCPPRILEVGCGEGYSTARLAAAFPGCRIDAIDIAPNIGRLYDGPPEAANFRIAYAEDIAAEAPAHFDVVVLCDVLHHVPLRLRGSLLEAIRTVLAPGGILAIKDWHRNFTPVHMVVHGADRWLTGDRVSYLTRSEARHLLESAFGTGSIRAERTIRPWRNNYALCVARG